MTTRITQKGHKWFLPMLNLKLQTLRVIICFVIYEKVQSPLLFPARCCWPVYCLNVCKQLYAQAGLDILLDCKWPIFIHSLLLLNNIRNFECSKGITALRCDIKTLFICWSSCNISVPCDLHAIKTYPYGSSCFGKASLDIISSLSSHSDVALRRELLGFPILYDFPWQPVLFILRVDFSYPSYWCHHLVLFVKIF